MSGPRTVSELRRALVERGRDPYSVLLPEDRNEHNPEARYLVTPLADGRYDVRVVERGKRLYHQVFDDETSAVHSIDVRLPELVHGPPATTEQLRESIARQEAERQRMLSAWRRSQGLEEP